MSDKKPLTKPVILEPKAKERTIGFERKPVSDGRKIEIDGLNPRSDYRLVGRLWVDQ